MSSNNAIILSSNEDLILQLKKILIKNNFFVHIEKELSNSLELLANKNFRYFFIEKIDLDLSYIYEWIKNKSNETKLVLFTNENNYFEFFNEPFLTIKIPISDIDLAYFLDTEPIKEKLNNIINVDILNIIQLISISKLDKKLIIANPIEKTKAIIIFKKGIIIHVQCNNFIGEIAFLEIAKMRGGIFYEEEYSEIPYKSIKISTLDLIKKSIKTRDENISLNKKIILNKNKLENFKILIVDNNYFTALSIGKYLEENNFMVIIADSILKAIKLLKEENFGIVISEVDMPALKGMEFFLWIKKISPETKVFFMGKKVNPYSNENINALGIIKYLKKPFGLKKLYSLIKESFFSNLFTGQLSNLPFIEYLKLVNLTKKTKVINVIDINNNLTGKLFVKNGNIINAIYSQLNGEDAFFVIANLENYVYSEVKYYDPKKQTIDGSLKKLILKFSIIIDEKKSNETSLIKFEQNSSLDKVKFIDNYLKIKKMTSTFEIENDLEKKLTIYEEGIALGSIINKTTKEEFINIINKNKSSKIDLKSDERTIICNDFDIIAFFNENNILKKILFREKYLGKTIKNIGIGSKIKDCINIYGKPIIYTNKAIIYSNIGFFSIGGIYITSIQLKDFVNNFFNKNNEINKITPKNKLINIINKENQIQEILQVNTEKTIIYEYGKIFDILIKRSNRNEIIDKIKNKFNILGEIKGNKINYNSLSLSFVLDKSDILESIFIGDKINAETEKGIKIGDKISKAISIYNPPLYKTENTFTWKGIVFFTDKNDIIIKIRLKN